jgi:DNA methyltransferase 1-associated protein 1
VDKMTSNDVRDVLNLPDQTGPRPAKKQKITAPRSNLKGLAREVQSLGGDNPIAIVPEISIFKKRRLASRKPAAKWEFKAFTNSARDDPTLVLRHWKRATETGAQTGDAEDGMDEDTPRPEERLDDSMFAKFNVKVRTPEYSDEQYKELLESEEWTRHETDYLVALVQEFDLRWPVIWDRYEYQTPALADENGDGQTVMMKAEPKERTLEELKKRYYHVAAEILKATTPLESMDHVQFDMYEKMRAFNPEQETLRKKYAETAFNRTPEEVKEEENLLLELKRILARAEKMGVERKELYNTLEAPTSQSNMSIYTSSQGLQQLLQQLMLSDKTKKRRSLMGGPDGVSPASASTVQHSSFDRRDSNMRESISGPSGTNNKKGPNAGQGEHRQLTEAEELLYGVSHPTDRSSSGAIFRHEKLNKLITNKSAAQQLKITNTLGELGIPQRLIMPTAEVGIVWTALLESVLKMLDVRRQVEKAQGEQAILKGLKAEREKKERAARGEPEPEGDGEEDGGEKDVKVEEREKSVARSVRGGSVAGSVRGGSVGAHKRSASVLSAASDKSTKRQRK